MRRTGRRIAAVLAGVSLLASNVVQAGSTGALEQDIQRVAHAMGDADSAERARNLWGRALDAPVALHDIERSLTRVLRTGAGAAEDLALPPGTPPANTCITVDGRPLALLVLPLPAGDTALARLLWHERWHCVQQVLGLDAREAGNAHLDTEAGRVSLRLELRALAAALSAPDAAARMRHARVAVALRAQRAAPGSQVLADEVALERNEGLAEYTGRRAAEGEAMEAALVVDLRSGERAESFVRSFAYLTGPAYGALLDRYRPGWRAHLHGGDGPAALLAQSISPRKRPAATEPTLARYGAGEVRTQERDRAQRQAERRAELEARFVRGAVLAIDLRRPSASFDPRALFPLGEEGVFHTPLTVTDEWGELKATGGALLANDWTRVRVEATSMSGCGARWQAPGWTLSLAPGWALVRNGTGATLQRGAAPACTPP